MHHRVGEDIDRDREIPARHGHVVVRRLVAGAGVHRAARLAHLARGVARPAPRRPLEHHVLDAVRPAEHAVVFVIGSDAHPDVRDDDGRLVVLAHEDDQAVLERLLYERPRRRRAHAPLP